MSRVVVLMTNDEQGLAATLHRNTTEAYEELRRCLNAEPVDYQEELPEHASHDQIAATANERAQFSWGMSDQEVPA